MGAAISRLVVLTDTTNSFVYNPVANTIGTIAAIPRATGETRALNFNGKMLVMGGGRTAPNPSNEVDVYDPVTNTWAVNTPVPAFATARRNFPTDTDGTTGSGWQAATIVRHPDGLDGNLLLRRRRTIADTNSHRGNAFSDAYVPTRRYARAVDTGSAGSH